MPATAKYGSWDAFMWGDESPTHSVTNALEGWDDCYDVPGLVKAYTAAINAALPHGISLHGSEFFGPYPKVENYVQVIQDALKAVDFWELSRQYDNTKG